MKKKLRVHMLLIIAVLILSAGCSIPRIGGQSPNERAAEELIVYQGIGETLVATQDSLRQLCHTGTLSQERCKEAKEKYNEAVAVYKRMGDGYLVLIDGRSKDTESVYSDTKAEMMLILNVINSFLINDIR